MKRRLVKWEVRSVVNVYVEGVQKKSVNLIVQRNHSYIF